MFSLTFCMYWGNIRLATCPRDSIRLGDCFFGTARIHVFYYALHALGQYQASEFLLQDRIDSICLIAFYRHRCNIRQANSFCGIAQIYVCIVFDTHLDSSRLTSCCCGVARIHVSIAFYTHWRTIRLTSCICGIARIHFCYCILHALGYYQTCDLFCGIARTQIFYIVLHAFEQGHRLTCCCCRITQIHVFYLVLHTFGRVSG